MYYTKKMIICNEDENASDNSEINHYCDNVIVDLSMKIK